MQVFSGECEHGTCGTPTDLIDSTGEPLRVGDIVMVSSQEKELTPWHHGLSVVVEKRPNLTGMAPLPDAYVMGIASVDVNNDDHWIVTRVKRWEDVVAGEHWKAYGFNYRMPNTGSRGAASAYPGSTGSAPRSVSDASRSSFTK